MTQQLESPFCVCGHHEACHEGYGYADQKAGNCLAHEITERGKIYCACRIFVRRTIPSLNYERPIQD